MADRDTMFVHHLVEFIPVHGTNQFLQGKEHLFGNRALSCNVKVKAPSCSVKTKYKPHLIKYREYLIITTVVQSTESKVLFVLFRTA